MAGSSRSPGVAQMDRQTARRQQNDIETHVEIGEFWPRGGKKRGGAGKPTALMKGESFSGGEGVATRFHLDKDKCAAASRDQVDFAEPGFHAAPDDAIELQPQQPYSKRFGAQARRMGGATTRTAKRCGRLFHAPSESASARA